MATKRKRAKKEYSRFIKEKIEFTEEEKNLIKEYCDIRIKQINTGIKIPGWCENTAIKKRIKSYIDGALNINPGMFDELHSMVWNFEYLDKEHNELNLSILSKLENTEYYQNKCNEFEEYLKKEKEKQKLEYKQRKANV